MITNAGENAEKGDHCALFVEMQIGTANVKNSMEFLKKKLKIQLPYDLAIPLLGINPKQNRISKKYLYPCVALFTMAKIEAL